MRILVVDDEEFLRSVLSRRLKAVGHAVDVAASGWAALALQELAPYDAVITDFQMPEMTGVELFERLVASDASYAGRVIFMSGDPGGSGMAAFADRVGRPCVPKLSLFSNLDAALSTITAAPPA